MLSYIHTAETTPVAPFAVNHIITEDIQAMKNLKRFISGSLATLMLVGAMITGASAKSYDDVASTDRYAEQIEILSDIGVIKGTSETEFSPDEKVTREQMALLLFRLMIGKDTAGTVNTSPFTDLNNETYSGAISWANASGYIIGTSQNTFEPRGGIMLQDAMTMLVRALGHSSVQMNNGYPWTYIDAAVKLDLDNGIEDLSYTKELTRSEVSALLYNALTAEYLIPRTASNGMTFYESTTIIERVFGYTIDESVIVATNHFALEGVDTVTKDGYVTVHTEDGFLTVKYAELGLKGEADEHLGKNFKLVYKRDDKTKLVNVLGCTELGKTEAAEVITPGKDNAHIEIGGVKYQVVEALSDALATNANELLVYAFDSDASLAQIKTNAALSELLGAYDAELIFNDKNSTTADRLIIKPFKFGKLEIKNGKVNLAGGMKETDLTIIDEVEASSGDHVLYYFNEANKSLELAAVLPTTESGKITRLTSTTATIGGKNYTLGSEKLGVTAASIREQLTVGATVRVVVFGDIILAVDTTVASIGAPSQYLIAQTTTTPAFIDGKLTYAMEAFIDGTVEAILVTNRTAVAGNVYRYTVADDGTFTLIPMRISGGSIVTGDSEFVQSNKRNDEIAFVIESAASTTIAPSGSYHTITAGSASAVTSTGNGETAVSFVMNDDTVIIVKNGTTHSVLKGVYNSAITVRDGATVTAIFDNEIGSVETLRYLYVSDGSLGDVITTQSSVKILAKIGVELIDGSAYTTYSVLDLAAGKVGEMHSKSDALSVGTNYLVDAEGFISSTEASVAGGVVSGYTKTTITIGGETFALASDVKFSALLEDDTTSTVTIEDVFMGKVEFLVKDGKVTSVILLDEARFSASYADSKITVSAVDTLKDVDSFAMTGISVFDSESEEYIDLDTAALSEIQLPGANFSFEITLDDTLVAGDYLLTIEVNEVEFIVEFTVA